MSRYKLEIIIGAETKFGCINKVVEIAFPDIDTDTSFELWLDNTFGMIKTEALNEFRAKKERNFIKVEDEI